MQHFPVDHPFYLCHLLQHLYTLMLDKTFVSQFCKCMLSSVLLDKEIHENHISACMCVLQRGR